MTRTFARLAVWLLAALLPLATVSETGWAKAAKKKKKAAAAAKTGAPLVMLFDPTDLRAAPEVLVEWVQPEAISEAPLLFATIAKGQASDDHDQVKVKEQPMTLEPGETAEPGTKQEPGEAREKAADEDQ